ncbi:hypothetical protein JTB14_016878 [Gonioctena quinquepunctata]|nr:hypothetical protein JTB14_016878 [Gonioctena quinquepunctata]
MNSVKEQLYQCRLCLHHRSTIVNVYEGDFSKMIEMLTSIEVRENDGLPKFACSDCIQDVEMALSIKTRIMQSHRILMDALEKEKQLLQKIAAHSNTETLIIVNDDKISNEELSQIISDMSIKTEITLLDINGIKKEEDDYETYLGEHIDEQETEPEIQRSDSTILNKNLHMARCIRSQTIKTKDDTSRKRKLRKRKINTVKIQNIKQQKSQIYKQEEITDDEQADEILEDEAFPRESYQNNNSKFQYENAQSTSDAGRTNCHLCGRYIITGNMKKHLMLHTAGPSTCTICGVNYKNNDSLRSHMYHHRKTSTEEYLCEECGKSYKVKYKLYLHKQNVHLGLRNFKCEICGKRFFTRGDKMSHVRKTHEKLRPHVCEFCKVGFSSAYALKTHRRQHTNEKPFVCHHCEESFRQRVSLRLHLKSKHGIKESEEFPCEICGRGFASSHALQVHERLHLLEKCELCSETIASDYLDVHLEKVHGIVKEAQTGEENGT